ncbi:MAG: esterase/lipase family protein [Gemmatimonadaceae bacterium]
MARNPLVLVHGYSDEGSSFRMWQSILEERGYDVAMIHACTYRSLTNEVSIKDIAEGFDRALRIRAGLSDDEPFDAIVHSTGMLVIRAWLTAYDGRRDRLKHLIGLAPATFGSPLAHKGRSWLGALFKGNRQVGPDFLEAGDRILDGLELGSRFTWDLAHLDLLADETFYGPTRRTPYVFVFCGNQGYGGLRQLMDEPGSDGTVRWSGCPLNTRKIILDLTRNPAREGSQNRISVADWKNVDIPLISIDGKNHGTILTDPGDDLVDLVDTALQVSSEPTFTKWIDDATRRSQKARAKIDEWQQFVVRALDERGDPITDYNIQLFRRGTGAPGDTGIHQFDLDVHTYKGDPSLRCFHVKLADLDYKKLPNLWVRVIASSGSSLVGYQGYGSEKLPDAPALNREPKWDATLNISSLPADTGIKFFYPFTTTLIELRLNREPLPLTGKNEICWF